jgi:hypothetical protein
MNVPTECRGQQSLSDLSSSSLTVRDIMTKTTLPPAPGFYETVQTVGQEHDLETRRQSSLLETRF